MIRKIINFYKQSEKEAIGDKFISILEVIYAIILACGVVEIVKFFQENYTSLEDSTKASMLTAIFVLVRFFFAPSKNIKVLGEKAKGWKWSIMLLDVPLLILHSFIYYLMCHMIGDADKFFQQFFNLLILNSIWLFLIWGRLYGKKIKITYIKIWAISNLIFFISYKLIYYRLSHWDWKMWFVLAALNCFIDLITTYASYFRDEVVLIEK